jgi:hypothetical protein
MHGTQSASVNEQTIEALHAQLAALMADQRAEEAAIEALAGLMRFPDNLVLRNYLAHALLLQGRYRDGFREFEARAHRRDTPARQASYPEWSGPIAGRSILVWGEQGIGDEIQTVRFVRTLREMGAGRITVTCWAQSVRAFQQVGADLVINRFGRISLPQHDCWVSAWSIPHQIGLRLEDVSGAPYLKAEPRGPGGIGLVERGRPDNPNDALRSIPAGMLQAAIPNGRLIEPEGDVYDSLCRIAALDLLITVDTSWAHMAGALGVPCWLLLPYRGLDWRWMREVDVSPWYSSMRLFRQPKAGDWPSVIREVVSQIRER